jgi:1,4-dihydroxy-2-naphthoate polyprenyltransferase
VTVAAQAPIGKIQAWRSAARPRTLTAAIAPVLVGSGVAIADDVFDAGPATAALLGAIFLQIGANFANDVFDFRKGADTSHRLGPPRATQHGLLTQREMFTGMWLAFAAAMAFGIYLVAVAGWPVVAVGLSSIVAAIIYTGGPWPIGYHALGDVFTFVFFGVVAVAGTYYVQAETVSGLAWAASIPLGCTVTAILVVNNLRDIDTDRTANKTTLAVIIGRVATRVWYVLLLAAALVVAIGTWVLGPADPWVLIVLLSVPVALPPLRAIVQDVRGRPLNQSLGATATFHLAFGLTFAIGLSLS